MAGDKLVRRSLRCDLGVEPMTAEPAAAFLWLVSVLMVVWIAYELWCDHH